MELDDDLLQLDFSLFFKLFRLVVHHDVGHRLFEVLGLFFKLSGRCEELKPANFETDEFWVSILLALVFLFRTFILQTFLLLSKELGLVFN